MTIMEKFIVDPAMSTATESTYQVGSSISNLWNSAELVPESQAYFWTREWQEGEREADMDIDKGDLQRFDDPMDAIRWLLCEE